jgi:uncharacterized membrane protein YcaP (DUF421 family)
METVIRVTLVYLALVVGLRVLGKREFSQLSPLELVTLLLVPELVASSLHREDSSLTNALIALATLFSLAFITSLAAQKSKKFEQVITGAPTLLVVNGNFIEENLNKERVSPGEIFGEMHKAGLVHLSQVKWAILEGDGKISIVAEDTVEQARRGKPEEKSMTF